MKKFTILIAEDDMDDYYLLKDALLEKNANADVRLVTDGSDLMDYLLYKGKFQKKKDAPRPELILLDLNMPKIDGREALSTIKSIPDLKQIPIVIFTTSKEINDICQCYKFGANSYISKPDSFKDLSQIVDALMTYWMNTVSLPDKMACDNQI